MCDSMYKRSKRLIHNIPSNPHFSNYKRKGTLPQYRPNRSKPKRIRAQSVRSDDRNDASHREEYARHHPLAHGAYLRMLNAARARYKTIGADRRQPRAHLRHARARTAQSMHIERRNPRGSPAARRPLIPGSSISGEDALITRGPPARPPIHAPIVIAGQKSAKRNFEARAPIAVKVARAASFFAGDLDGGRAGGR